MTYWRVRLGRFGPALATYPSGTTFGPRVNKDFELVWLVSGRATWVRHDLDFRLGLKPGTLLLTRPSMMDELLWREPSRHGYVTSG